MNRAHAASVPRPAGLPQRGLTRGFPGASVGAGDIAGRRRAVWGHAERGGGTHVRPVRAPGPREPGQLRDLRANALRVLPLRVRAHRVRPGRGMRRRRVPVVQSQRAAPASRHRDGTVPLDAAPQRPVRDAYPDHGNVPGSRGRPVRQDQNQDQDHSTVKITAKKCGSGKKATARPGFRTYPVADPRGSGRTKTSNSGAPAQCGRSFATVCQPHLA